MARTLGRGVESGAFLAVRGPRLTPTPQLSLWASRRGSGIHEEREAVATTMNISLPDVMKAFVDEQVQNGGFGTVSEYVRDLVRRDQKERAQDRLEALLLEGLESGPGEPVTPEFGRIYGVRFRNAAISGSKSVESGADRPSRRES